MQITIDVPANSGPIDIANTLRAMAGRFDARPEAVAKPGATKQAPLDDEVEEPATEETVKRGRGRPKGASSEPKKAALAAAPEPAEDFDDAGEDASALPFATQQEVREAVNAFFQAHGKDKTLEILNRFHATKIGELKPAEYSIVIETLKNAGKR
jgi:hypothetical protein